MKKKRPKSLILFGNGINCEYETAYAHKLAGFEPELMHINMLREKALEIHNYMFIHLPGGFLDGDDLGSAKAQAVKWKYQKIKDSEDRFIDELVKFVKDGKIILGICNGFQLLVKTGLLPGLYSDYGKQAVTLTFNDSGRFEDRWVSLKTNQFSSCIFTRGMDNIYLPVRHGEGKLVPESTNTLNLLKENGHIVMQYVDEKGCETGEYPYNPNGSIEAIAGLCDPSGRIFGLMPHPEAYIYYIQHPRWTRENVINQENGLKIFNNAFKYVTENI
ncbi:MAG: phosphoribosylformylglycinamidine synthase subunit PurQ [Proteobacteria bacterium]|nr:phosphoribosylformylglycinamidine synthase subunit PurQ [Pseudomonadota bacterium]